MYPGIFPPAEVTTDPPCWSRDLPLVAPTCSAGDEKKRYKNGGTSPSLSCGPVFCLLPGLPRKARVAWFSLPSSCRETGREEKAARKKRRNEETEETKTNPENMSSGPSDKKKLPRILPAPEQVKQGEGSGGGPGGIGGGPSRHNAELPPRKRRIGTGRFACDACRTRKSAVCLSPFSHHPSPFPLPPPPPFVSSPHKHWSMRPPPTCTVGPVTWWVYVGERRTHGVKMLKDIYRVIGMSTIYCQCPSPVAITRAAAKDHYTLLPPS